MLEPLGHLRSKQPTHKRGCYEQIQKNLDKITDWKNINDLIPQNFKSGSKYIKSGKAGIFAGSLELVKEGNLTIKQENLFDDIYVKEVK